MQHDEVLVENLFHEALELAGERERQEFLSRATSGDAELMRRVERLLFAHDQAGRFLSGAGPAALPGEEAGQLIGRYKLLEKIGEGGFGSVWMAEQREPVKRRVAVKVIKLGMDTKAVIARFEAERQALALMEHPNIARVLDAGSTDTGRPYFVMELVRGVSIVEYCDTERLDTDARLALFTAVCRAIQHAHQKGVIHRDIKPSNVLVTLHDGVPVPKVIDFGIAKATESELTTKTMFTEHRHMVGTPAYMSPEQAEMSGLDIDTRADVYSLGVLLYELLTGTTPLDTKRLLESGYAEWIRAVREVEPHKPSTRVTTLGAAALHLARSRRVDVRRLGTLLRGDLDWIVMKCLEKDRTRRYDTVSALADDVARHLSHEPVSAGPPSGTYRLLKFVRRNRVAVVTIGAVSIALVLGIIGTGLGLAAAKRESGRALALAEKASRSATEAESATERASIEAARARAAEKESGERADQLSQVVRFQQDQLSEIDVSAMAERMRTDWLEEFRRSLERDGADVVTSAAREAELEVLLTRINFANVALKTLDETIFERAIEAVEGSFAEQPLVRAQLFHSLAITMLELGLLERAVEPMERALSIRRTLLGETHLDTLSTTEQRARLCMARGRLSEAETALRNVLSHRRRVQGSEHLATVATALNLAAVLFQRSCPAEAEPIYRDALALYMADPRANEHAILNARNSLAVVIRMQGRAQEAAPELRIIFETSRRLRGPDHPVTLTALDNLGTALMDVGQHAEAEACAMVAFDFRRRTLGDEHPDTLGSLNNVANVFTAERKFEDAEFMFQEALARCRRRLGATHPMTLGMAGNLCAILHHLQRDAEALPLLREQVEACKHALGSHHETTLIAGNTYAQSLMGLDRIDEAVLVLRETADGCSATFGSVHPSTLQVKNNLGLALWSQDNLDEALLVLRDVLAGRRAHYGAESSEVVNTLTSLGMILLKAERYADAEPVLRECRAIPPNARAPAWGKHLTAGLLGASLAGQGRHAEADALLVEGFDDFEPPPGREDLKHTALEHLIEHYRAWGKLDRAAHYESLRATESKSESEQR